MHLPASLHFRLLLSCVLIPYIQADKYIQFNSPLLSDVPHSCVNPHTNLSNVQLSPSDVSVPCLLPFWWQLNNGNVYYGARLGQTSETYLLEAGVYTMNWAFFRNTTAQQIKGNDYRSACVVLQSSWGLMFNRPIFRILIPRRRRKPNGYR